METKHIVLAVGGVLVAGGIGFYLYNKSKSIAPAIVPVTPAQGSGLGTTNNVTNTPAQQVSAVVNTANQAIAAVTKFTDESFPLKVGMIGPNVKAMQAALKSKFNEVNVSSDGMYGPKTLLALVHQKYATMLDSKITEDEFKAIIAGTKK